MKQKVPLRLDLDGGDGGKEEEELMAGEETVSTQYGADPAVMDMGAKETDDGDIDEESVHHPLPSTASQSSVPSRKRKTPVPPQPPESPGARSSTVYSGLIGTPSEEEPVYPVPAFEASRSSRASRHEVDWVSSEADCGFSSLNLSLDIESLMASGYAPPPPPRPPPAVDTTPADPALELESLMASGSAPPPPPPLPAVDTTPAGPALELESLMASGSAPPPPPPLPAVDTTPAGLALDQLREESTKKEPIAKGTLSKSIVLGPSRKSGSTEPEVADMSMLPQTEKVQAVKNLETSDNSLEAPVCALVDVMYKLPAKLDGVLRHGHMLPKGAEDEIPLIKQDLELMVAVLHDYNNSGAENCAMMIKCLMKEVRELAYDIEDCIDQYENAVDSRSRPVFRIPRHLITRRKSKASRLPKKLKKRLWMANKIREFSMRSQEALQRYILFNPEGISTASPSSSSTNSRKKISTASTRYDASFGSWHPTPYGESAAHPVGIDAPMSKLKVWLAKDGEQNVKVISIVGSGGIGKTTLANELYHTIGGQFECRAFVRTSQKPDIKRLLISILSQVWPHRPQHTWKVHNLISDIRTHLQDKRYLIIIDDVWSTSTWDIVSRALPESNHCSRIIITTEIEDVALRCCAYDPKYVFMLKPLSHDDSRILFFNTAFGCEHECSPDLLEVSSNIIKKCGGLPLALVTIASVLASRMGKLGQWDYVNKSLGYGLRTNPTVDGMKQVLNLSYDNLPWHLKVCLLYLSMYQEDWILWRDDLVKQWIAEGFICATEDEDKEEIARRYFDELISSRMIQPAHINYNDEVLSCTVHHMVLNLITHKSIEENFIIAIDHSQTTARLADKVRRLSLHFGNSEDATLPTNMRLSQLRTLAFFGVLKSVPSIMEFQLLQVLILELWGDEENMSFDLTRISELFRLRYFQVTSNVTLELRTKMQGLQYLETLKIDARLSVVPSDFCLPSLLHLNLPSGTKLPAGIARMTSLHTLGYVDLNINSIENVDSLGKLTNLQDLQLTYMAVPSSCLVVNMEFLGSILGKLSNLKSLTLVSAGSSHLCTTNAPYNPAGMIYSGDGLSSMACPPALLRRLELPHMCIFSSLPRWIGGLAKLRILKIAVRELSKTDVDVLKKLPVLTVLSLFVGTVASERIAFDRTGFLLLRYFKFRCTVPWLKFEASAMPNLLKLKLGFSAHGNVWYGAMPVGIEYLSVLKEVSAKIWCVGPEESNRMTAESALRDILRLHRGRLRVEVQHVDKMFDGQDDKSSVTKEDHRALKQCDILVDDRNEQFDVLQKNMGEDTNKQADGWGLSSVGKGTSSTSFVESLAEGEAPWSIAFPLESPSTRFDLRPGESMATIQRPLILPHSERRRTDDGYNWRKYGQTQVKGSENPRSYYKCAFPSCPAKKKVERSLDNQIIEIVYKGRHNHPKPHNTDSENFGDANSGISGTTFEEPGSLDDHPTTWTGIRSEVFDDREAARQMLMCAHTRFQFNQRPEESMAAIQSPLALIPQHSERRSADDGYNWRKYGQKVVKGSENSASYYKCTFPNCSTKKKVERSLANHIIEILYKGRHNHPKPHSTGRYSGKMLHSSHEDFGDANSGITGTTFEEPGSSDDESPWTGILSEVLPVG